MISAVFYLTSGDTGRILMIKQYEDGTASVDIDADGPAGTAWIDDFTANMVTDYILSGVVTPRPVLLDPLLDPYPVDADGTDTVIVAMPSGTQVDYEDEQYTSTAENFVFTTTVWGEWTYRFSPPWPYVPLTLTIVSTKDVAG